MYINCILWNTYSVLWQSGDQSPSKPVRLKQGRVITSNCLPHAGLISFQLSSDVCSETSTYMQTFLVSPRPWEPPSSWLWHQGPRSPEEEQPKWPVPRHRRSCCLCGTWLCSPGHRPPGGGFLTEQKLSSTELSPVSQGSLGGCARRLLLKEMCAVSHEHYRLHAGGQVGQWDQRVSRFHIEIMGMCLCFCLPLLLSLWLICFCSSHMTFFTSLRWFMLEKASPHGWGIVWGTGIWGGWDDEKCLRCKALHVALIQYSRS